MKKQFQSCVYKEIFKSSGGRFEIPYFFYLVIYTKNTEGEEFVLVHDLTSAQGHWFNRVEKLHDYYEIRDANKVFEYLEKHNLKSHL